MAKFVKSVIDYSLCDFCKFADMGDLQDFSIEGWLVGGNCHAYHSFHRIDSMGHYGDGLAWVRTFRWFNSIRYRFNRIIHKRSHPA